jgi:hypothetical protein
MEGLMLKAVLASALIALPVAAQAQSQTHVLFEITGTPDYAHRGRIVKHFRTNDACQEGLASYGKRRMPRVRKRSSKLGCVPYTTERKLRADIRESVENFNDEVRQRRETERR